jgi:hypothetical protein
MAADLISIAEELNRLSGALRTAIVGFEASIKEAADFRTTYDTEYAKAFLSQAEGTVKERESEAILIVKDLMRAARISEATRDAYKERIRAIEAILSVQQSLLRHLEETKPSGF